MFPLQNILRLALLTSLYLTCRGVSRDLESPKRDFFACRENLLLSESELTFWAGTQSLNHQKGLDLLMNFRSGHQVNIIIVKTDKNNKSKNVSMTHLKVQHCSTFALI